MLWRKRSQMTFIRVTIVVKRLQKTQIRMETLHASWFLQKSKCTVWETNDTTTISRKQTGTVIIKHDLISFTRYR